MFQDGLSRRMKRYEALAESSLMPGLPVLARLDGRAFHTWAKGLERPFDAGFRDLMTATAMAVVRETSALCGYTQSDEITVLWAEPELFEGRVQKLASNLASIATAAFNLGVGAHLPKKAGQIAYFDTRVWSVPSREEAFHVFLWREQDATKNSIAAAAQSVYSHQELMGKNAKDQQELLFQKGINWNDYPDRFKRGSWVRWKTVEQAFEAEELAALPPKHAARLNPELVVRRRVLVSEEVPPLGGMAEEEREGFLFGACGRR